MNSDFTKTSNPAIEISIVEQMIEKGCTLSLAESCTGGAIASRIVNVPGASKVLVCGMVTYTNRAKRQFLGVKKPTLKKHGAVSEKCAHEMAKGGRISAKTDFCLSVTGLAGPDGGTKETPVGTVFIGCSRKGHTEVREFHFMGDRAQIREQAVTEGLAFLHDCIQDYPSKNK